MAKVCFFCGLKIIGKSHMEHIFSNAFLGHHSLKNEKITFSGGKAVTYSRVKVDSHSDCNSTFGSRYEQKILSILNDLSLHQGELETMHTSIGVICPPSDDTSDLLIAWFIKLYFGMTWYEANRKDHVDPAYQKYINNLLNGTEFRLMQKAYRMGKGFSLPSSIYYFRVSDDKRFPFDQGFMRDPPVIWMKLHEHFFVVSIGDGQLTYKYINEEIVTEIRRESLKHANDPLFFLIPLSHVIAVRRHLPKTPSFVIAEDSILNMSMMTMSNLSYAIDGESVNEEARKIQQDLLPRYGVAVK